MTLENIAFQAKNILKEKLQSNSQYLGVEWDVCITNGVWTIKDSKNDIIYSSKDIDDIISHYLILERPAVILSDVNIENLIIDIEEDDDNVGKIVDCVADYTEDLPLELDYDVHCMQPHAPRNETLIDFGNLIDIDI
jgi:hypothetical protein